MGWTLVNWGFAERFGAGHMGAGIPADPSCQEKDHLSMTDALKLVTDKLVPAFEDTQRQTHSFLEDQRQKMGAAAEQAQAHATANRVIAFVAIALTAVCAILMTLSRRRMIAELNAMTTEVAKGADQVARAAVQMTLRTRPAAISSWVIE